MRSQCSCPPSDTKAANTESHMACKISRTTAGTPCQAIDKNAHCCDIDGKAAEKSKSRIAGDDCTESMRLRKRRVYARHLEALRAEGIEYRPLVWSCWGREHPDSTAILSQLARQAACRQGAPGHVPLLRRARAQIGAAIARRCAAMLRACMPGVA